MNIYVLKCFFEASCMSHVMDSQTIGMFKYTLFDCCNLKVFICVHTSVVVVTSFPGSLALLRGPI